VLREQKFQNETLKKEIKSRLKPFWVEMFNSF
jgi:hypothetical protein